MVEEAPSNMLASKKKTRDEMLKNAGTFRT